MKSLGLWTVFLTLPLVGLLYSSRNLWSGLLALLAGLSLACSKSGNTPAAGTNPSGAGAKNSPESVVTCYQTVAPEPILTDPKWVGNGELGEWAQAERAILSIVKTERIDFNQMEPLIQQANNAYGKAQVVVGKGLLSAETYQLAGQFFADWHQTIAASHSTIMCYEARTVTPMIADINNQLTQLNDLRRAGKLNKAAVDQATIAIKARVGKEKSPVVADELTRLLIQLLGY